MLTFEEVKKNPLVKEFIGQTAIFLKAVGYTDHGSRHVNLVAKRAGELATSLKLPARIGELCQIAGYCHDMGNFLGRSNHHYWGALLFSQVFKDRLKPEELVKIMQAITGHDKKQPKITNPVTAMVILADKSDVNRSRVNVKNIRQIRTDIHDRVNYSVTSSRLEVNNKKKAIVLKLKVDAKFTPVMEYFEIFTDRMVFCRQAANYLGYKFNLEINNFKLL
ncbi:MAG: HD domain-containing protein [bacterium]